jgi:hypothetical protein
MCAEDPYAVPKRMGIFKQISRCVHVATLLVVTSTDIAFVCACQSHASPCPAAYSLLPRALVPGSDCNLTVREIIARITAHQEQYATKFVKKKAAEDQYYDQRYATAGQPAGKAKP